MDTTQQLFDAIRGGDANQVRTLVAQDHALVNARNDRGHSPVLIAQYHRQRACLDVLLAAGPTLDIHDAASVGATARVAELLDSDPALLNSYSGDGFFPLALAAFFGHPETVRLLLARGADPTLVARNPMKVQALHSAVAARSFEAVKLLVEAGAPVNGKQQEGWAPLHEAVNQNNVELVQYLLAHGADPKQQNDAGTSAIGLAGNKAFVEVLKVLKAGRGQA
jgi:ankyrin repeat protein